MVTLGAAAVTAVLGFAASLLFAANQIVRPSPEWAAVEARRRSAGR